MDPYICPKSACGLPTKVVIKSIAQKLGELLESSILEQTQEHQTGKETHGLDVRPMCGRLRIDFAKIFSLGRSFVTAQGVQ